MHRTNVALAVVACAILAPAATPPANAQGNPPGMVSVSGAVTGIRQFDGRLDGDGKVGWGSVAVSGSVTRQFVPAFAAGVSARYVSEDWRVRDSALLGSPGPWERLQRPGATVNLSLALSRATLVRVSPTVEWAYDSRADFSDGAIYGAVVSGVHVFSPKFVLGAGASVTRQFYDVKTSPFVIVNWQLAKEWRIANAAGSGPLGGAGVELRWTPNALWEFAAGGVSRSDRWRLADAQAGSAQFVETSAVPILARVSRQVGPRTRLDVLAGVLANCRATLRDRDGRELRTGGGDLTHDGYDTAPTVAASWSVKF
jgi:hypothetical protein